MQNFTRKFSLIIPQVILNCQKSKAEVLLKWILGIKSMCNLIIFHAHSIASYCNSGKIHLSKFSIQNYSTWKFFIFEGDRQKFCGWIFSSNVIKSLLIKCKKQPDNGNDRYASKCKHHLGSEHTFKHTAEFLQSSFYWLRVAAQALILHASNETQHINTWLLFLVAITDIRTR